LRLERVELAPRALLDRAAAAVAAAAAARGIALAVDAPEPLPFVRADERRVVQILRNLLANALTHTPAGGRVRLSAAPGPDHVRFEVRDTGAGIAAGDLPHVFERFWRADPSRDRATGGAGLGLAIVQHMVHAQGGEVSVESRPGAGAAFSFTLPLA
jgi:two-component system sensor histidine kinase BaeS